MAVLLMARRASFETMPATSEKERKCKTSYTELVTRQLFCPGTPWRVIATWLIISVLVIGTSAALGWRPSRRKEWTAIPGLASSRRARPTCSAAAHSDSAGLLLPRWSRHPPQSGNVFRFCGG